MDQNADEVKATLEVDGQTYNLKAGIYIIGKLSADVDHDILIDDMSVDIKHAAIQVLQDGSKIIDMFSKYGTAIEDEKLKPFEVKDIPKTANIKFGNIIGLFRTNELDSGIFHDSPFSDIVPGSPERSQEQLSLQTGISRIRNRSRKSITSTPTSINKQLNVDTNIRQIPSTNVAKTDEDSFLIPSTQNTSKNDISLENEIRNSISAMENEDDDDDFFIPETQEVHTSNTNNDEIVRINTQDFTTNNEEDDDFSQNLLNEVVDTSVVSINSEIIPFINPNANTSNILLPGNKIKSTNIADNQDEDTDCEEEMSALNWNDTTTGKKGNVTTNMLNNQKSASVTPELDFGENNENQKKTYTSKQQNEGNLSTNNEELEKITNKEKSLVINLLNESKSASVTPDLEFEENNENQEKTYISNVQNDNNLLTDTEGLEPTQVFVAHLYTKPDLDSKVVEDDLNISPSNKENFLNFTKNRILNTDKGFAIPFPVRKSDSKREYSFKEPLKVKETKSPGRISKPVDDDDDLMPTQVFHQSMFNKTEGNVKSQTGDDLLDKTEPFIINQYQAANVNTDENDIFLQSTQEFQPQRRTREKTPILLDSDEEQDEGSDTDYCMQPTLPLDDSRSTEQSVNKESKANKDRKGNKTKISRNKIFGSSDEEDSSDNKDSNYVSNKSSSSSSKNKILKTSKISGNENTLRETSKSSNLQKPILALSDKVDEVSTKTGEESNLSGKKPKHESKSAMNSTSVSGKPNLPSTSTKNSASAETKNLKSIRNRKKSVLIDIPETPDFGDIKLPSKDNLKKAGELFINRLSNDQKMTFPFEQSSDEDDESDITIPFIPSAVKVDNSKKKIDFVTIPNKQDKNKQSDVDSYYKSDEMSSSDSNVVKNQNELRKSTRSTRAAKKLDVNAKKISEPSRSSGQGHETGKKKQQKEEKLESVPQQRTSKRRLLNIPDEQIILKKLDTKGKSGGKVNKSEGRTESRKRRTDINNAEEDIKKTKKELAKSYSSESSNIATTSNGKKASDNDSEHSSPVRKSSRNRKPRIVFTKIESCTYEPKVKKIGGTIVENPRECTVLITDKVYRTWKFLSAMARGIPIVYPEWLDEFNSPTNNFLINDKDSEKRFKFNLKKSLHSARKTPIFENYIFYITPGTKPTPTELTQIIKSGNGIVTEKLSPYFTNDDNFYIISDKSDKGVWPKLKQIVPYTKIIKTEGIMLAVLQQRIQFKHHILL